MKGITFFLILFIYSCNTNDKQNTFVSKTKGVDEKSISLKNSTSKEIVVDKQNNILRKWVQYKKIPVINQNDTLPYPNCFIEIKDNKLLYYLDDQLKEEHFLVRDTSYDFEVYKFRDKPDDLFQFLDKQGKRAVLKRDNFDGLQEYFKAIES